MALQSSGQISLADIAAERGVFPVNASLTSYSTTNVNQNSTSKPDGSQPHSISEFYGYDHNASPPVGLSPINLSGPFESLEFACNVGGEFAPWEYYYSGDSFVVGSQLFLDADGNEKAEANSAWYSSTGTVYQLDDGATLVFEQPCGGGKGGKFP